MAREPHRLAQQRVAARPPGVTDASCAAIACTGMEPLAKPRSSRADALEVGGRGGHDVDPAVGVVDPVDRHLVDAQPAALGQHQQFGVEEPAGVGDVRQQPAGRRRRGWP